jgi:integrase
MNLRALTPTHVRTLLANKAADGLGARSIRIIHSTLRTMLSEAMREELIERNCGDTGTAAFGRAR